jgi:hypothetical protein
MGCVECDTPLKSSCWQIDLYLLAILLSLIYLNFTFLTFLNGNFLLRYKSNEYHTPLLTPICSYPAYEIWWYWFISHSGQSFHSFLNLKILDYLYPSLQGRKLLGQKVMQACLSYTISTSRLFNLLLFINDNFFCILLISLIPNIIHGRKYSIMILWHTVEPTSYPGLAASWRRRHSPGKRWSRDSNIT